MSLTDRHCIPCEGGVAPLTKEEAETLSWELKYWSIASDVKSIHKTYTFKDWKQAHEFVNKISEVAEAEGHHPDIDLHWGKVGVTLRTQVIGGLSENDFILAAKIDAIA